MINKKTTIWRKSKQGGTNLVTELPGFPHPMPTIDQEVYVDGIGPTICRGISKDMDGEIVEIKLFIR